MSSVPAGQPTKLPAFDNSLGALYIGSSLATVLYGVICVQTFLYITSNRTRFDSWAMKLLVFILFSKAHLNLSGLDTTQQCLMLAGMYRFLITDYANPVALSTGGPSSGLALATYDEAIVAICSILLVQLFFCWRVWTFSGSSLNLLIRIAIITISVSLALLNFVRATFQLAASYICLSIFGFRHHFFAVNSPNFTVGHFISNEGPADEQRISDDSESLPLAITGNEKVRSRLALLLLYHGTNSSLFCYRSNHVIVILILLTVNTNLVTTLLSISALVTYLVLPNATIYGGIYLLLSKSYLNSFLAILNSRDFLQEKMDYHSQPGQLSIPDFAGPSTIDAASIAGEQFELSLTAAAVGSSTSKA
ncbi:hypothetical protein EV421DRAFT_1986209 [Armillaria borealis]|uniref:DUF6534 domain-containing protein n=1 Tax=Armillaria borealis TaxID=47425 RepID=A0AA39J3X5_9AGAR|nr:hypothetical protein EV421DRAFT_1986209 [Armillaria borealis]